jgi:hypothetical protein
MAEKSASGRAAVRETLYFVKNLLHIVVATRVAHHTWGWSLAGPGDACVAVAVIGRKYGAVQLHRTTA